MSWMTLPSLQGCTRGVPESATLTTTKKRTDSMRILMREPWRVILSIDQPDKKSPNRH